MSHAGLRRVTGTLGGRCGIGWPREAGNKLHVGANTALGNKDLGPALGPGAGVGTLGSEQLRALPGDLTVDKNWGSWVLRNQALSPSQAMCLQAPSAAQAPGAAEQARTAAVLQVLLQSLWVKGARHNAGAFPRRWKRSPASSPECQRGPSPWKGRETVSFQMPTRTCSESGPTTRAETLGRRGQ